MVYEAWLAQETHHRRRTAATAFTKDCMYPNSCDSLSRKQRQAVIYIRQHDSISTSMSVPEHRSLILPSFLTVPTKLLSFSLTPTLLVRLPGHHPAPEGDRYGVCHWHGLMACEAWEHQDIPRIGPHCDRCQLACQRVPVVVGVGDIQLSPTIQQVPLGIGVCQTHLAWGDQDGVLAALQLHHCSTFKGQLPGVHAFIPITPQCGLCRLKCSSICCKESGDLAHVAEDREAAVPTCRGSPVVVQDVDGLTLPQTEHGRRQLYSLVRAR